jgi:hypothetical protein
MHDAMGNFSSQKIREHYDSLIGVCGPIPIVLVSNMVEDAIGEVRADNVDFHKKAGKKDHMTQVKMSVKLDVDVWDPIRWLLRKLLEDDDLIVDPTLPQDVHEPAILFRIFEAWHSVSKTASFPWLYRILTLLPHQIKLPEDQLTLVDNNDQQSWASAVAKREIDDNADNDAPGDNDSDAPCQKIDEAAP